MGRRIAAAMHATRWPAQGSSRHRIRSVLRHERDRPVTARTTGPTANGDSPAAEQKLDATIALLRDSYPCCAACRTRPARSRSTMPLIVRARRCSSRSWGRSASTASGAQAGLRTETGAPHGHVSLYASFDIIPIMRTWIRSTQVPSWAVRSGDVAVASATPPRHDPRLCCMRISTAPSRSLQVTGTTACSSATIVAKPVSTRTCARTRAASTATSCTAFHRRDFSRRDRAAALGCPTAKAIGPCVAF